MTFEDKTSPEEDPKTGLGARLGRRRGRGRGLGRRGGSQAAGPDGYCVCPQCGHKVEHVAGQPCYEKKCPQCNTEMMRE